MAVDALLTVKGYLALSADYEAEATACDFNAAHGLEGAGVDAVLARQAARRCREKAYDLLGVVTIPAEQMPMGEMLVEV